MKRFLSLSAILLFCIFLLTLTACEIKISDPPDRDESDNSSENKESFEKMYLYFGDASLAEHLFTEAGKPMGVRFLDVNQSYAAAFFYEYNDAGKIAAVRFEVFDYLGYNGTISRVSETERSNVIIMEEAPEDSVSVKLFENGSLQSLTYKNELEISYDIQGRIEYIWFDSIETAYTYTDTNVSAKVDDGWSSGEGFWVHTYDDKGLLRLVEGPADMPIIMTFDYDECARMYKAKMIYGKQGYEAMELQYDANNHPIKAIYEQYEGSDTLLWRKEFEWQYDQNQNPVHETSNYNNSSYHYSDFEYDANGNLIKETYQVQYENDADPLYDRIYEYEYNANNKIVKRSSSNYSRDGSLREKIVSEYTYNEAGELSKTVTSRYDAQGNLISQY